MSQEDDPFKGEKIKFPVECHFKVIAEDLPDVHQALDRTLREHGLGVSFIRGNSSGQGTYVTYNVTLMINSLEQMNEIDSSLRKVAGVRMVL